MVGRYFDNQKHTRSMEDFDPISLVEATYRLNRTQEEWMRGLVRHVHPIWDEGFGVGMFEVRIDDAGRPDIGTFVTTDDANEEFEVIVRAMNESIGRAEVEHSYERPFVYSMLSERMKPLRNDFREDPVYQKYAHPLGIYDCRAAQVRDPSGTMYILASPCTDIRETTGRDRAIWSRIVAHMAAADRLRRREAVVDAESEDVDAVIDASGRLVYVNEERIEVDTQGDALERAAEAIGRARGRMRRTDAARALEIWRALVQGEYSLVEFVDTDGKEFLFARRNAPSADKPAALTQRERQVVHYMIFGHPDRLIGYELGLEVPDVRATIQSALDKMNLSSREELVRVWSTLQVPGHLEQ